MRLERKVILACDGCAKQVEDFAAVITYRTRKGDIGEPDETAKVDLCDSCWVKLMPEVTKFLREPLPPKPSWGSRIFGGAQ